MGRQLRWDCAARRSLTSQQYSAYKCVRDGNDDDQVNSCVQALGANQDTAQVISAIADCYSDSDNSSTEDYALCALKHSGNNNVATAAKCIADQAQQADFGYVGAAVCYAGDSLKLNPELQIAVQCIPESGGQPYAYAACVGGRLLVRELSKCFTQDVGGDGCFGRNNEIVKALRIAGIDVNNLTNPNGEVVKAWNTATREVNSSVWSERSGY